MVIFGIILVYMVMASQFESLKYPLIIMFSIPFALSGVFLLLLIANAKLSAISFIGIVMLIGIVVNNAIVLIDYINYLKKAGGDLKKIIIEVWRPLGISVAGGLIVSTIVTLIIIPILYFSFDKKKDLKD